MSFDLFLETLTKVAILKSKTATPGDALQSLLSKHMVPLHTRIFGAVTNILDIKYDKMVALILSNASTILMKIYCIFFQQEIKGFEKGVSIEDIWKQNEKSLFMLLKQFDICPNLLSKSAVHNAYLHTKKQAMPIYELKIRNDQEGLDDIGK